MTQNVKVSDAQDIEVKANLSYIPVFRQTQQKTMLLMARW